MSREGLSVTGSWNRPIRTRLSLPRPRPPNASVLRDAFDRDYWLAHCEGFRVEADEGAIGFVESVSAGPEGEPTLAVRAGLLGRRVLLVPAGSVAFIVPRAQRIWLHSPVHVLGTRDGREEAGHDA
jgi:hypothetical protein